MPKKVSVEGTGHKVVVAGKAACVCSMLAAQSLWVGCCAQVLLDVVGKQTHQGGLPEMSPIHFAEYIVADVAWYGENQVDCLLDGFEVGRSEVVEDGRKENKVEDLEVLLYERGTEFGSVAVG